jgi:hypothetical protein
LKEENRRKEELKKFGLENDFSTQQMNFYVLPLLLIMRRQAPFISGQPHLRGNFLSQVR